MPQQEKYEAIDPKRRLPEKGRLIDSIWGEPTLVKGSRVIKQGQFMDARAALTRQYLHKIAKEALADLNVEVPQFRIIAAPPKKKMPLSYWAKRIFQNLMGNESRPLAFNSRESPKGSFEKYKVRREPGKRVTLSKRIWLSPESLVFHGRSKQFATTIKHDVLFPLEFREKVKKRLEAAGLEGIDHRPKNFAFSRDGKTVMFEPVDERVNSIGGRVNLPGEEHGPLSDRINSLVLEYKRKLALLESYRARQLLAKKRK